jgi:hypothetical protein
VSETRDDAQEPIRIRVDPELASLIPGFLENRRKDVTLLLAAVQTGDFETVRILGHSMKGSGGGYGFDGITDIGGDIEVAAKHRDPLAIRTHVEALAWYLARVEVLSNDLPPVYGSKESDTF